MLEVHQFQFTVWPENGEPQHTTPLLSFHKRVDNFYQHEVDGPMVVHCSAGLERTGIFIVVDTQIQRIKNESTVDIFNNVQQLCYSRNYMIQTQVATVRKKNLAVKTLANPTIGILADKKFGKLCNVLLC